MRLLYGSIVDRDLSIYPGKSASILYMGGCALRCGYCNAAPLVTEAEKKCASEDVDFFVKHLIAHQDCIDAVCLAGGEPFMQPAAVYLCKRLKHEGFLVKAETSGFYPEALKEALPYLDYVSMDVKTALKPEAYAAITGFKGDDTILVSKVLRAIAFLEPSNCYTEFRTTIIPGFNDNIDVIEDIAGTIRFADQYTLQQFNNALPTINAELQTLEPLPQDKMIDLAMFAKRHIKNVKIRTVEGKEEDVL